MNQSAKTQQRNSTHLSDSELLALVTLLSSGRAWYQFQEQYKNLRRTREIQKKTAPKSSQSKAETRARAWIEWMESAEDAGVLAPSHRFLMRVHAVETVHDERCFNGSYDEDLASINAQIDEIRLREGLDEDEDWGIGEGPEDWNELNNQYEKILDMKFEETLREFGLNDIANLYRDDRETYDARREEGRCLVFEDTNELETLSTLHKQFEAEAEICAQGKAYLAAATMIGAAVEAALLFACLNRRNDALEARDRLPRNKRPESANPKYWRFAELVQIAREAGWLPDFEVEDEILSSHALIDMVRHLRNMSHPARHLSDKGVPDVEHRYKNARATYVLLKRYLVEPTTD